MRAEDLVEQCAKAINDSTLYGLPNENAIIMLKLPKGWKAPPKFPRGKTAQWKPDGSRIAYFSAMNVLAWLAANGAVTVDARVKP